MDKTIDEYLNNDSWRIKANANHNRSFSGLQSHIAGTALAKHALGHLGKIGRKHLDGAYHLHNLETGLVGRYCNGNDALSLLHRGLINVGGVNAKPVKHFSTACLTGWTNIILRNKNQQGGHTIRYTHIQNIETFKERENLEILTEEGFKKIKRFIKNSYKDEWIHIILDNGMDITVTKDHPCITQRGIIKAQELKISDYIPLSNLSFEESKLGTYDQGRFVGLYLAEGNENHDGGIVFTFNINEKDYVNFVKNFAEINFLSTVSISEHEPYGSTTIYVNGNSAKEFIFNFVNGHIAREREISYRAFNYSLEFRKGLIDGLYEGDAIKYRGTPKGLVTSSIKLAKSVIALLNSIGETYTFRDSSYYKEKNVPISSYRIARIWHQKSRFGEYKDGLYWSKISKIENKKQATKWSYDIEVDSDTHLFRVANGIVTHNCDQLVNFTYLMTGEFAGAQGWRDLDVLLAPYIYKDNLTYDVVKQNLQQFIWNLNFNMRPGYQTPFVNLSVGLRPSKYYEDLPVLAGEVLINSHYSDYQDEIDLFNRAFFDILIESPDGISPFVFPMPTINITKDFKWDSEISEKIFELASKWGTPYFANYLNTDLTEEDALSMCCRLKIDLKDVQKFSGGIWNFGANTGSLAVFTINMSRIGYMSNGNEKKFYKILDSMLEDGRDYLLKKKEYIRQGSEKGLFPMTDTYIGKKLYKSYFLTIGINGLNECSVNFCGKDIIENKNWCEDVLKYISRRVLGFQQHSGQLFNFEAVPGEGCGFSLARLDREKFPDIFTQGTQDEPYYTGSSLIPMNVEIGIPDAIRHQESLQRHYTGGTVFHIDTGEMASAKTVKDIIRNVLINSTLPYVTWSPTHTVCPIHGKQNGRGCECEKAETWSRVVGYYRPTNRFNIGRKKEFSEKKFLKI